MSDQTPRKDNPKEPTMLDAFIPVISLVILLAVAVVYFGNDSSYGPNQIGLLFAMGSCFSPGARAKTFAKT